MEGGVVDGASHLHKCDIGGAACGESAIINGLENGGIDVQGSIREEDAGGIGEAKHPEELGVSSSIAESAHPLVGQNNKRNTHGDAASHKVQDGRGRELSILSEGKVGLECIETLLRRVS
jgi:hypothetical protein